MSVALNSQAYSHSEPGTKRLLGRLDNRVCAVLNDKALSKSQDRSQRSGKHPLLRLPSRQKRIFGRCAWQRCTLHRQEQGKADLDKQHCLHNKHTAEPVRS